MSSDGTPEENVCATLSVFENITTLPTPIVTVLGV